MSTTSKWAVWLVSLAALGGGGYYGYQKWYAAPADASADAKGDASADGGKSTGSGKGAKGAKDAKDAKGSGKGRPMAPVAVALARSGTVNVYLNGLGTITPLRTVTVRSRVDGQLMRLLFKEGQTVREGDLLAEIDARPFQAQLLQAEGQMARDRALLANARVDLDRYRLLLKQDSIAEQQVATQQALVQQLEGTVKNDQGQVDAARLQVTYSRVIAPISGLIGLRQVDQGNVVRAGDTNGLAVITQLKPITALFTIPQDSLQGVLKRLKSGEKIPVDAFNREQTTRIATGRLLTVDNQIDTTTGTIKLKAEFPNGDGQLYPNQFVNIRMLVDTREDAVTVPASAIQRGAQGLFVYVVNEDQTVSMRPVKTGVTEGTRIEIESGVKPPERVVIDGMDRLRDGMRVEIADRGAGGDGKGKGRRGKGADGGDAKKGDAAKTDAGAGNAGAKADAGKDAGREGDKAADPERERRRAERRKQREAEAAASGDAPKEKAATDRAKSDAAPGADAGASERPKRGDGEARKKKKDADSAAP